MSQTTLFGPCEKKSKKVVKKESTAITSSDAARTLSVYLAMTL